ncbi:MAG: TlpA family protein disulfide reductase [Verrucomicrobiae bacterium]|nr:TlpA family protein disulfide reductase [Verrucomicrobiae bacterium]
MKLNLNRCLLIAAILFAVASSSIASTADMVGKPLPPFKGLDFIKATAPDIKGKPVLVEFWATWCPPCRKSIPHLNEIYEKYQKEGLQIVGISNEPKSVIKKFMETTPMKYHVASDEKGDYSKPFDVEGIPHAFLIDKTGKIVWEGHPMDLQESAIEKVLK